jgi:tetratricopeptide (TPR) repeat protein
MKIEKDKIALIAIAVVIVAIFLKPLYEPLFKTHEDDSSYRHTAMHLPDTETNFNPQAVQYEKQAVDMISNCMQHDGHGIPVDTMKRAIALLQKSLSCDRKYQLAYVVLVQYQTQIRDYRGAFRTLKEAERWRSDDPVMISLKGSLYDITGKRNLADKEYAKAIGIYDQHLKAKPNAYDIYSKSVLISFLMGEDTALAYLKSAMAAGRYEGKDRESLDMLVSAFEGHSFKRNEIVKNEMTNSLINFNPSH